MNVRLELSSTYFAPDAYATAGVNYSPLDHLKRMAQEAIRTSQDLQLLMGVTDVPASRGESAHLVDMGTFYTASVVEGLGTKNRVADDLIAHGSTRTFYDAAAWDTVAMIVNDMITVGAEPLVIGPHWAVGDTSFLNDRISSDLISGWMKACHASSAVYGPGETAVLKDIVNPQTIELSGFGYGVVNPKSHFTLDSRLSPGDHIMLIESNGVHANGLTLARKLANQNLGYDRYKGILSDGNTLGEALMKPTHIYVNLIKKLFAAGVDINYMVNITGHGWRKIMRAPQPFTYRIHTLPPIHPEFLLMQRWGEISDTEMYSTFNMGAGFAVFVPDSSVETVKRIADLSFFRSYDAGIVENGQKQVVIEPKNITFAEETLQIR